MKKVIFLIFSAAMVVGCGSSNVGGALGEPPQPDNNKVDTSKIAKIKAQTIKVKVPKKPVDESKYNKIKVPKL